MFVQTTRPLTSAELDRLAPGIAGNSVIRAAVVSALLGPAIAMIITLVVRQPSLTPPARGLLAEWWEWVPWITAYTLVVAMVVIGVAAFQRRRRRTELLGSVVTETRVSGDLAVVVCGLSEGELDVVVIRTDGAHAWTGEAYDVGCFPDSTTVAACVIGREMAGKRLFKADEAGARIPLLAVQAVQEETSAFEAVLRRHVLLDELPPSVRRVLASGGTGVLHGG